MWSYIPWFTQQIQKNKGLKWPVNDSEHVGVILMAVPASNKGLICNPGKDPMAVSLALRWADMEPGYGRALLISRIQ